MYYVYGLKCKEGFYIGCTSDLKERIARHQKGQVPATAKRLPVELVAYFAFKNRYTAFNFEKYLKSGSGRAFIKKHLSYEHPHTNFISRASKHFKGSKCCS